MKVSAGPGCVSGQRGRVLPGVSQLLVKPDLPWQMAAPQPRLPRVPSPRLFMWASLYTRLSRCPSLSSLSGHQPSWIRALTIPFYLDFSVKTASQNKVT